jgi:acyl-CoA synthetase (AMP-forming)/AMP-acid ligase II
LAKSFVHDGISLMALMRFSAHYYPNRCAVVSDGKRLTYKELYEDADRLAKVLYADYGLKAGMSVGLLCKSHLTGVLLLLALSRLGVNIKLINTDIAPSKISDLVQRYHIKLLIHDAKDMRIPEGLPCLLKESSELLSALTRNENSELMVPHIKRGGEISVFTGGSSGKYKEAPRRMSVFQFLPPFFVLLKTLRIDEYDSVFLPLPMYHGFGLPHSSFLS